MRLPKLNLKWLRRKKTKARNPRKTVTKRVAAKKKKEGGSK